ncbi:MAG: ribosome recycling factor [Rhodospirillaceae bacterium]|nr:ribosome recycling factor [Rhodospirillaceae bacterium]
MSEFDVQDLKRRMDGAIEVLQTELAGLRTGRASAGLLEPVTVEAYGSHMPLNQVATVSVPEPRMLSVQVWDKGLTKAVEKAIRNSGLGLNPLAEGQTLRIPVPELTEDRRRDLAKMAGKYGEQAKVSIRNVRRDGMEALKRMEKDGTISQDEHRNMGDKVQSITDDHVSVIDEMLASKEKEIMQV